MIGFLAFAYGLGMSLIGLVLRGFSNEVVAVAANEVVVEEFVVVVTLVSLAAFAAEAAVAVFVDEAAMVVVIGKACEAAVS